VPPRTAPAPRRPARYTSEDMADAAGTQVASLHRALLRARTEERENRPRPVGAIPEPDPGSRTLRWATDRTDVQEWIGRQEIERVLTGAGIQEARNFDGGFVAYPEVVRGRVTGRTLIGWRNAGRSDRVGALPPDTVAAAETALLAAGYVVRSTPAALVVDAR
jgi:hypothetical protein